CIAGDMAGFAAPGLCATLSPTEIYPPMNVLTHRKIVLGVTGGIAAYKSADLTRRLQDAGAEVRVVMTAAATQFVGPLTFQALSGNPVHLDLLDPAAEAAMGHIELARWADLVLVEPASDDFMARHAHGLADDLLTTLCLATRSERASCRERVESSVGAVPLKSKHSIE